MSHATVLVFFQPEDPEDFYLESIIEEKMYPFYEQPDLGDERLEFEDKTEEWEEEYKTGTVSKLRLPDGTLKNEWDYKNDHVFSGQTEERPADAVEVEVPHTEAYVDFRTFVDQYYGGRPGPDGEGWGYYSNPNAKWDWWQIGGRWHHLLKLKEGVERKADGEPSWGWDDEESQRILNDPTLTSVAPVCDIDWDAMYDERYNKQIRRYDQWQEAVAIAAKQGPFTEEEMQLATEKFSPDNPYQQAVVKTVQELAMHNRVCKIAGSEVVGFLPSWTDFADFNLSRAEFEKQHSFISLTHAILDLEDNWIENGEMGWWACVIDEGDKRAFGELWWKSLRELPKDAWVAVVDYHI